GARAGLVFPAAGQALSGVLASGSARAPRAAPAASAAMPQSSGEFMRRVIGTIVAAAALCAAAAAEGQIAAPGGPPPNPEAVVAGDVVIERPTLMNLGFEWFIQGDANRNAEVSVAYGRRGATDWSAGMPLLRLDGERIYAESRVDVVAPNMFAGSVLDLD